MKSIWKFPLKPFGREDTVDIKMPVGADIIRVDNNPQHVDSPSPIEGVLWAIVDPNARVESRRFHVIGTGWTLPEVEHKYIGSWQHGGFIWHVLEIL